MNSINRQLLEDGVCVLTFDRQGSSANIFDRDTLAELSQQIDFVARPESGVRGLVLTSAKDGIFIAGADLYSIRKMSPLELRDFITLGQQVFTRIAGLPCPTVAAIHGVAVGGGCEITLACDWRIATPDAVTKIGLPETQLGILPAWGGCTRLPRLIGVPDALDIILGGKTLTARHALKLGLLDELVPREYLLRAAFATLKKGKHPQRLMHSAPVNAVLDTVLAPIVRKQTKKRTHGHYPAVQKAMEVVLAGASDWQESDSLSREREAVSELLASDATRQLLNLFFLQDRAKKLSIPKSEIRNPKSEIESAAVIGAGIMGAGIAQWLSARGLRVILRDLDATRVAAGMGQIAHLYSEGVKRHAFSRHDARAGMARIAPAPDEVPLGRADIVIEAAVEKMDIKKTIFRRLDDIVREDCVLATNTSALSITDLAAATKHPARVIGLHFFNPVHRMQLVEVVTGRDTAPEVAQRALRLVQRIGKFPVLVKDSPGFLVNRILLPGMIEAASLYERGASVEAIDEAMLDFGMPMGPLRLIDEVGVDVSADVAQTLSAAFPDRMRVPKLLPAMIAAGMLGRKTGEGFYLHPKRGEPEANEKTELLRTATSASDLTPDDLERRMVLLMVNEAVRCLSEKIVAEAADVDFAMVMGTGWAPFRGGPLRYADTLGTPRVDLELSQLAESAGAHFAPCALLTEMAKTGKRFYED